MCERSGRVSGVGDTPLTVMNTRAPAVLIIIIICSLGLVLITISRER